MAKGGKGEIAKWRNGEIAKWRKAKNLNLGIAVLQRCGFAV
jgi:hypothetical protein